jgi:hypothetical protein
MTITEQDVLDAEYKRLVQKKSKVDTAIDNQKRALALTSSYSKKYAQYTKIVIAIVIGLFGYLAIQSLETSLTIIPGFIFDLLSIVLLAYVVYTVVTVTLEINSRSPTNYDELNLPPISVSPTITDEARTNIQATGNIIDASGRTQCSGDSCCPGRFNQQTNLCAFTTIEGAYDELLSSKIGQQRVIQPYDDMELRL